MTQYPSALRYNCKTAHDQPSLVITLQSRSGLQRKDDIKIPIGNNFMTCNIIILKLSSKVQFHNVFPSSGPNRLAKESLMRLHMDLAAVILHNPYEHTIFVYNT